MSVTRQRTARSGWRLGVFEAGASVPDPAMPTRVLARQETQTTSPGVDRRDGAVGSSTPVTRVIARGAAARIVRFDLLNGSSARSLRLHQQALAAQGACRIAKRARRFGQVI